MTLFSPFAHLIIHDPLLDNSSDPLLIFLTLALNPVANVTNKRHCLQHGRLLSMVRRSMRFMTQGTGLHYI